jgi:hypothetical protein
MADATTAGNASPTNSRARGGDEMTHAAGPEAGRLKWCWEIPVIDGVAREPVEIAVVTRAQLAKLIDAAVAAAVGEVETVYRTRERDIVEQMRSWRRTAERLEEEKAAAVGEEHRQLKAVRDIVAKQAATCFWDWDTFVSMLLDATRPAPRRRAG